jgi:hypothetical protein
MTECFICNKGIGFLIGGFTIEYLRDKKVTVPEGFTVEDRICTECMKDLEKGRSLEDMKDEAREQVGESTTSVIGIKHGKQEPTSWMWTVPIFLGLLGGILGYIALKDYDQGRANDMISYGLLSSVASIVLLFVFYSVTLSKFLMV